jgi:antitoxin-like ribbon-helix-helix protein
MNDRSRKGSDPVSRRKLIEFDPETWHALQLLGRDSMKTLQELADEAFSDLLRKHNRPVTLREALRASARRLPANDEPGRRKPGRS